MKILPYVDLGKAFQSLKNSLIEIEKEAAEDKPTVFDTANKYARAYGRLSMTVQIHIAANTDTDYDFVDKALKSPENGFNEAPTLLLYEQTHWDENENPNDIPEHLFLSSKA